MNRQFLFILLSGCLLFSSQAAARMASFVADAVQAAPGQEERRGKLYVSRLGTRFEFTASKQSVIQIIQPSKGLYWFLFPKTKTYLEVKSLPTNAPQGHYRVAPCEPTALLECRKLDHPKDKKGRLEQWIAKNRTSEDQLEIWWDPARHMIIRQKAADGSRMNAKMAGTKQFEGRVVELWTMRVTLAGGAQYFSYMLYAPDLGFPVMEQGSKGLVKELHNVKSHPLDQSLYSIPDGYKKIEPAVKGRR